MTVSVAPPLARRNSSGTVGIENLADFIMMGNGAPGARRQIGIYTWETLHDLALNADDYWQRYLQALAAEGKTRDEK